MGALSNKLQQIADLVDEAMLLSEGVEAEGITPTPSIAAPTPPAPVASARRICFGSRVSPEFRAGVLWIQEQLGLNPDFLMACMAFETGGTFSPSIKNPQSSATGLIQFMDATTKAMAERYPELASFAPNKRSSDLAKLTAVQQLSWVYYYFKGFGSNLARWELEDTYMAILLPSMIGKPLDTPMNWNTSAYRVNRGLDLDRNGTVTKREATGGIRRLYAQGMTEEMLG
jgi:hypothetical protein